MSPCAEGLYTHRSAYCVRTVVPFSPDKVEVDPSIMNVAREVTPRERAGRRDGERENSPHVPRCRQPCLVIERCGVPVVRECF